MHQRIGHRAGAQRAQQIDRLDVARALPDRVDRHFAIHARHHALAVVFDVAVAAETLHRLLREQTAALADPELSDRRQHAAHQRLVAAGVGPVLAAVERARQPQRQRGGGLAFEREVGQHALHRGLLDQPLAERAPLGAVVQRERQRLAHQARGAERTIEPRDRAHRQDLRHAAAFVADAPRHRVVELDLAAGVGLVAQLVFQPLDAQHVGRAVGQPARHEVAAQPAGGLREHQEGVAHRRRQEPLVAGDAHALAPGVAAVGFGARGVGTHVGAALLLGHAHAERDRGLARHRDIARVVLRTGDCAAPGLVQRRVGTQRRRYRIAHRHRAQHRRLGLVPDEEARGALDVRAGPARPRRAVQTVAQRTAEQHVVARMELNLVDAVAETIVRVQLRRVHVGQPRMLDRRCRPRLGTERRQRFRVELRRVEAQRVAQRAIGVEQVDVGQRRTLIGDFVRLAHGPLLRICT
ncbi:MAG: hypothetical protein LKCHEGNO_00797 [Burkholderiaceae bacterium]|nr:hypothetical protein [Burkholderiaceae bacterium]